MGKTGTLCLARKGLTALVIILVIVAPLYAIISESNASQQDEAANARRRYGNQPIPMERGPPSTGNLTLHVTDYSTLQNILGAYVTSSSQPFGQPALSGVTNSTGYIFFGALMLGNYTLWVSQNGYGNYTLGVTVIANTANWYEIRLQSFAWLSYRLLETSSGNPIQSVSVRLLSYPPGLIQDNVTNYSGLVFFNPVPPGNYTIIFSKTGYTTYVMNITAWPGQNPTWIVTLAPQGGIGPGGVADVLPTITIVSILAIVGVSAILVVRRRLGQGQDGSGSQESQLDSMLREAEHQPWFGRGIYRGIYSSSRRLCPYCGTSIDANGGAFCLNCGANIMTAKAATPFQVEEKRIPRLVGRCMICGLGISEDEEVLWCPFCRNEAHRVHLLEWLHVKDYCPVCRRHLNERDLQH